MRLFLDASCWFAAVYSPKGGSAEVLRRALRAGDEILTSKEVIAETIRNLRENAGPQYVRDYLEFYAQVRPDIVAPSQRAVQESARVIHAKDAPILAAAKSAKADVLVTLDQRHFMKDQVKKFASPTKIALPKDLL